MGASNRRTATVPPRTTGITVEELVRRRDEMIRLWQSAYPDEVSNDTPGNEGKGPGHAVQ